MANKTIPIEDRQFVRFLKGKFKNGKLKGKEISITSQPYIVGMYVALTLNGSFDQMSLTHKDYPKWINKIEADLTDVVKSELKYTQFISKEDIKTYDVLK